MKDIIVIGLNDFSKDVIKNLNNVKVILDDLTTEKEFNNINIDNISNINKYIKDNNYEIYVIDDMPYFDEIYYKLYIQDINKVNVITKESIDKIDNNILLNNNIQTYSNGINTNQNTQSYRNKFNNNCNTNNNYDEQKNNINYHIKQARIQTEEQKRYEEEYNRQVNNAINKAYHDAYIQDLKNRGYKIKYKKNLKDYFKNFISIIILFIVILILLQVPFVKNHFIKLYQENYVFKYIIDLFINLINGIFY